MGLADISIKRLAAEIPQRKKLIALALAVFAANLLLDRLTKYWALHFLAGRGAVSFLDGAVVLFLTNNSGAFLSLGAAWPEPVKYLVLLYIPLFFCAGAMIYLVCAEKMRGRIIIIATIAGGGMSNLLDRLFNGFRVTDFLNFGIGAFRTGVLNVADMSVTFGAAILLLYECVISAKEKKNEKDRKEALP